MVSSQSDWYVERVATYLESRSATPVVPAYLRAQRVTVGKIVVSLAGMVALALGIVVIVAPHI